MQSKCLLLIIFFFFAYSHSACDAFFLYNEKKISLCNKKVSFEVLENKKIKLYLRENLVYAVGKQSDVIRFLYDSGFKLKQQKNVNKKKFYEYSLDNITARNGLKNMGDYLKNLFPEYIECGEQEDVFTISIEKRIPSVKYSGLKI